MAHLKNSLKNNNMSFITEHKTKERQMTHKFENRYEITTDFNFKICYVKYGDKTDSFSIEDMTVEEYFLILQKYAGY